MCGGIYYASRSFRADSDILTYLFPYFINPVTQVAMVGTIFMTLAISIERYLGLCHPLLSPHARKAWFYIVPVVVVSFALTVPKFFELEIQYREDPETGDTVPVLMHKELR